jgi:hypothetical protein
MRLCPADPGNPRRYIEGESPVVGLRDRALIGVMVFTFARVSAACGLIVADIFHQQRRLWVKLHEKGGKFHEMPCHHTLEGYLTGRLGAPPHHSPSVVAVEPLTVELR